MCNIFSRLRYTKYYICSHNNTKITHNLRIGSVIFKHCHNCTGTIQKSNESLINKRKSIRCSELNIENHNIYLCPHNNKIHKRHTITNCYKLSFCKLCTICSENNDCRTSHVPTSFVQNSPRSNGMNNDLRHISLS